MSEVAALEKEIVDAASVVAVLLVFVFAYFSAVLPQIEQLRAQARPAADEDRDVLRARLLTYQLIAAGTTLVTALVLLLLLPLSLRALGTSLFAPTFGTVRVGLLLVEALLVLTVAALGVEIWLIARRRASLPH